MKKQLTITVAMASAIMALSACRQNDQPQQTQLSSDAVCVDSVTKKRVTDNQCAHASNNGGTSNAFLWYYLGRSSAVPPMGGSILNRSYSGGYAADPYTNYRTAPPEPAPSYRSGLSASTALRSGAVPAGGFSPMAVHTSTAVSRGGFGASAHSFSAGS
jgi:uncharacterized protein YgiB involved in biofilm formation